MNMQSFNWQLFINYEEKSISQWSTLSFTSKLKCGNNNTFMIYVCVKQWKPLLIPSKVNEQFHIKTTFRTQWISFNDPNKQTSTHDSSTHILCVFGRTFILLRALWKIPTKTAPCFLSPFCWRSSCNFHLDIWRGFFFFFFLHENFTVGLTVSYLMTRCWTPSQPKKLYPAKHKSSNDKSSKHKSSNDKSSKHKSSNDKSSKHESSNQVIISQVKVFMDSS